MQHLLFNISNVRENFCGFFLPNSYMLLSTPEGEGDTQVQRGVHTLVIKI